METGKIKTLFSDKEKTEALFPRTKVSAISDDNGVGLDAIMECVAYTDNAVEGIGEVYIDADTLGGRPASDFAPAGNYATESFVTNKIAEAQLSGGDVDLSGYATKDDIANIDHPVDSVNGKTGTVTLSATDVGAAPASHAEDKNNPHGVTAAQVGALPITGGTLTGELNVNDGVKIWKNSEGGNIQLAPPTGKKTDYWEADAYDGDLRFQTYKNASHPNGAGQLTVMKLFSDGSLDVNNKEKTRENLGAAPVEFQDNYAYHNGVQTNPQLITTTDPMGASNKPFIVDHEASESSYWLRGVRKVFFTNPSEVVTATFGLKKNLDPALWLSRYKAGSGWAMDYQALIVKEHASYPGCYYRPVDGVYEWLNPPMVINTEYRTAERWRGQPVYVKLVDCGALPNASSKEVSYSTSNMKPIDYYGIYADQQVPMGDTGINLIVGKNKIVITTTSDMSTMTLQVVVKYCKT